jgi:hypothetical protein
LKKTERGFLKSRGVEGLQQDAEDLRKRCMETNAPANGWMGVIGHFKVYHLGSIQSVPPRLGLVIGFSG